MWLIKVHCILIPQEVAELKKQMRESKDGSKRREMDQIMEMKTLERDLATANRVRHTCTSSRLNSCYTCT
jgi:hypothetical protein